MQVVVTAVETNDNSLVIYKVRKEYDNKPAYRVDVLKNLESIIDPDIVDVYNADTAQ